MYGSNPTTPLIETETLNEKIDSQQFKIIDFRTPSSFDEGHIPDAINIWRPDIINNDMPYGGIIAQKEVIEQLLSGNGISPSDHLIIYDDKGLCDAARLWWVLNYYGHKKISLLNGGFTKWKKDNLNVSNTETVQGLTSYQFEQATPNTTHYASLDGVKKALKDDNTIIVDTRELEEFTGETMKNGAFRAGRIPNSIWHNWSKAVLYSKSRVLKPIATLKKLFEAKGINPDKDIIVYCQSGVRSSHTTFVLTQLLGYPNVRNFDGSWIEWSYHKDLPISTGDDKPLVAQSEVAKTTAKAASSAKKDKGYWYEFKKSYKGYAKYIWAEITLQTKPWYKNYFWLLVLLSLVVWILEIVFPWRKKQPIIRKDFFIDTFYMFFNFFLFKVIIFFAFSVVIEKWFGSLIGGIDQLVLFDTTQLSPILQLIIFFVALDFVQWFTHVILHRYEFFWQFHKVHHSVEQMGFAAHFRFHWMENIFYTPTKYLMMMVIGNFGPEDAFIVYYITIAIGHLNHANIGLSYGPLKYIINNPKMHIWHHAYHLPEDRNKGVNFGISLSIWDYLFKTAYIPKDGRDIRIGFEGIGSFPKTFIKQLYYGFNKSNQKKQS